MTEVSSAGSSDQGLNNWAALISKARSDVGGENGRAALYAEKMLNNTGLPTDDESATMATQAGVMGSAMQQAEKQYMSALSSGDESRIAAAQAIYQKAERIFTMFTKMLSSMHERMMELIRNLGRI
ncbi:MAG: hypothetical protein K1X83_04340 [Oligoflexia bacterium]|nr:hypothetical protein [Oligoflexia bacterium]